MNLFCNLNSYWSLVPDSFCFLKSCSLKGTRFKKTPNIHFFKKNLLHAMAVLGYLPKLKGEQGLAFSEHFLHDFS